MIIFHPWIDRVGVGNAISSSSSFASAAMHGVAHVTTGGGPVVGASSVTTMVKEEDYLLYCSEEGDWYRQQHGASQFSSLVVEEHSGERMEFTPRQIDYERDDCSSSVNDEKNEEDEEILYESNHELTDEEEGPKGMNEEQQHLSSSDDTDASSNDIICVNCHALFRIHVDVTFKGKVDTAELAMDAHNDEDKNWFITLRDVTTQDDQLVYVQMDQPLDLRCDSAAMHSNGCGHSSSKGRCNNGDGTNNNNMSLKKCQSIAIIEVPYTSFSSNGYNSTSTSSAYHEMTNERIVLVSLLREWRSSDSEMIITKKRRIVDQWMINIVVPIKGDGSVMVHPIHSAKLRDVVKYDSIVSEESIKDEGSTSDESSSSPMYDVIIACLFGALGGIAILAIAFKFVVPKDDDEEEELMTTPGISALQHAIRDSNSVRRGHEDDEMSQQQSPQYASSEGRSRTEEELETQSARDQSTPTNLSLLFDDEAEACEVASNQDDEVEGGEIEDTTQEQAGEVDDDGSQADGSIQKQQDEAAEEDHGDIDEDTIQEQAEEDEVACGSNHAPNQAEEGEGSEIIHEQVESADDGDAEEVEEVPDEDDDVSVQCSVDQDEETPPSSNKRSTAARRNSLVDVDDIIQEQNESAATNSPLFYSPKYQTDETAPLPRSNISSQDERAYDQVEEADGADSNRTMSVEPSIMLLSNPAETNQPPIDYRAEWNEFGAFAPNHEVHIADDNEAVTTCAGAEESTTKEDEGVLKSSSSSSQLNNSLEEVVHSYNNECDDDDVALSGVSKRLFATNEEAEDEAVKASSIQDSRKDSAFDDESNEVDESLFLPNVNVQAEAIASPPLHQQRDIQAEAIASPPKVHRETMESNAFPSDEFEESMFLPNVDVQADASGSPPLGSPAESQQNVNLLPPSPANRSFAANASVTSKKSPPVSSPSNVRPALKTTHTPLTAPMSSSKEDNSPASFANTSIKKSAAERRDVNEALTADNAAPNILGNISRITAAQQHPSGPSPNENHHDLSYVNRSMSLSSSPSVTSAPRNSNSPSVTSEPCFSPAGWNHSDNGSNGEKFQQRKHRSLPFVSREDTSRGGKENASSNNSRTPLSAKATLHSPPSTVAATVAEFAFPSTKNGLSWRTERPVPVPSGSAGQNKRLGGSPEHFEHRGASSSEVDESKEDEPIDFMNTADYSSHDQNDAQHLESRPGKRSRSSKGSKKSTSLKRKKNVEKKLLATIKTSDKHKPPSGLSCLSQRLEEDVWGHSPLSAKSYQV